MGSIWTRTKEVFSRAETTIEDDPIYNGKDHYGMKYTFARSYETLEALLFEAREHMLDSHRTYMQP